jgi:nucleotide-binding universal stress UspA family protein
MKRFKNILFYADGSDDPTPSLNRAVELAESNQARLTLVDVIEPVDTPTEIMTRFNIELTQLLKQQRKKSLENLIQQYHHDDSLIYTKILTGVAFVEIIKFIDKGGYDLLIKQARAPAGISERLFGSDDLHLLRKCPCPVLIDRPDSKVHYQNVLAALELESSDANSNDTLVMDLATSLADREDAVLSIVHAWSLQGESMFRSGRIRLPSIELEAMLKHQALGQQSKLDGILQVYNMDSDDENVHLVKGQPAEAIIQTARLTKAEIIVMGTVGRVGIPGLFIGNTAEEVMQTTNASILAVKPVGFKSPVL